MFLQEFSAAVLASVISGILFKIIDDINKQGELFAIIIALKNECSYNSIHRGSSQSPFQLQWLEKALGNLKFHEQCYNIAPECLEAFELAKDAKLNQLARRKMVPTDVQEKMHSIVSEIENLLPQLKQRTKFRLYLWWRITSTLKRN